MESQLVDRELICLDCEKPFSFTAAAQALYARKGFDEEPRRCKVCRDERKARKAGPLLASAAAPAETAPARKARPAPSPAGGKTQRPAPSPSSAKPRPGRFHNRRGSSGGSR